MNQYQMIASAPSFNVGHSLTPETEKLARLGSRWNLEADRAIHGGHIHLSTQGCLGKVDGKVVKDIIPPPFENGVLLNREGNVKVPRASTPVSGIALCADAYLGAIIHSTRNRDRNPAPVFLLTQAPALRTGIGDNSALALTALAGCYIDEAAEDTLLHAAHLPCSIALGTPRGLASRRTANAMAMGAVLNAFDFDLLLATENRLFEGDSEVIAEVSALLRGAPGGGGTAEEGVKDVAEATKDVETLKATTKPLTHMPEAIVVCPPFGVGEHLIGLVDLLEPLLSPILPVVVGMALKGELSECSLYLRFRGRAIQA